MIMKTQRDTALSTYANRLLEYLKMCNPNITLSIAYNGVGDEVDRLISTLDEIPTVVIGRGTQVQYDGTLGLLDRERLESISAKPDDGSPTINLIGRYFIIKNSWQFVVIARNQSDNMEIATHILKFNNRFYRTYYDVALKDKDGVKYRCKSVGFIQLLDVLEKEFSPSTNQEIALVITACEYDVKEQNFSLSDDVTLEEIPIDGDAYGTGNI